MKIAILGWGSLIWDSRNLELDKKIGQNGWFPDGPMLPIEFARISLDGRLTLVIDPDGKEVQTLYSISKFEELDEAILDLSTREGSNKNKIGSFSKLNNNFSPIGFQFKKSIKEWIKLNPDIEALIWTNLSKNFEEKIGLALTEDNVINYLRNLTSDVQMRAEQYFRKTHSSINTRFRNSIAEELKWTAIET